MSDWQTNERKRRPKETPSSPAGRQTSNVVASTFADGYDILAFQRQLEMQDQAVEDKIMEEKREKEEKEMKRKAQKKAAKEKKKQDRQRKQQQLARGSALKKKGEKDTTTSSNSNNSESVWEAIKPAKLSKNARKKQKRKEEQEKYRHQQAKLLAKAEATGSSSSTGAIWNALYFVLNHAFVLVLAMLFAHIYLLYKEKKLF